MRVLAFEDSYDIEKILVEGGVDLSDWEILQYWNTMDCFERIENSNQTYFSLTTNPSGKGSRSSPGPTRTSRC